MYNFNSNSFVTLGYLPISTDIFVQVGLETDIHVSVNNVAKLAQWLTYL